MNTTTPQPDERTREQLIEQAARDLVAAAERAPDDALATDLGEQVARLIRALRGLP